MAVVKWAWIAFVMFSLIPRSEGLRYCWRIWRQVTVGAVLKNVGMFAVVIVVGASLCERVPVLAWSWLNLFHAEGNNVSFAPLYVPWLAWPFMALLAAQLPLLAEGEELMFRKGTVDWLDAVVRSVAFGLMHAIVGVPIGFCLAMSLCGLWLTRQYFRGGVERSTVHHATYNAIACVLIALTLAVVGV